MHIWALTGIRTERSYLLYVHTDDDGLVTELQPPGYRARRMSSSGLLMLGWEQYEAPATRRLRTSRNSRNTSPPHMATKRTCCARSGS